MKQWLFILNVALFYCNFPLPCQADGEFENIPQLVVKGEASVFKPADQMEVVRGVVTTAETSALALQENNQKMNQVVANLQGVGLDESDYQTGRFRIQPIYRQIKDGQESKENPISHYEVTNTIQIKTQKIFIADKVIDAAVQGGVNRLDQVSFNVNSPHSYREEVIKMATQFAIGDAKALANAAGVRLVKVLYLSLDHWQHRPVPIMMAKVNGPEGNQTPFEPGNVEIQASVNLIYQIGPEKG